MLRETEVNVGGVCINVVAGPVSGPPLLMLHGVTRRWQTFAAMLPAILSRWHVHAIDFPGHGRSERTAERYRVVDYVSVVSAFVRERFPEPAVIYGHSLGSMVAAGVAAECPASVRGIVMEDPPFETMGKRIRETALHGYFTQLKRFAGSTQPVGDVARELAQLELRDPKTGASQRLGDVRDAAALRFTAASLARLDPGALEPVVQGDWLQGFDWESILSGVLCPSLLLQADDAVGGMLIESEAAIAAKAMADCSHVRMKGVGHLIHGTRPGELLTIVMPFLESL
ncbi:MAG: alpha/beta fold hydrolase [Planctomycetaceae bacterium]